jgi:phosphoenolpyruvate carboxylase
MKHENKNKTDLAEPPQRNNEVEWYRDVYNSKQKEEVKRNKKETRNNNSQQQNEEEKKQKQILPNKIFPAPRIFCECNVKMKINEQTESIPSKKIKNQESEPPQRIFALPYLTNHAAQTQTPRANIMKTTPWKVRVR